MKRTFLKVVFGVVAIILSTSIWAQDIIITTDAQKIEAKITEVSKSEIRYKEADNLEGPTFVLETTEINSIIYANGKVVLYNQDKQQSVQKKSSQEEDEELRAWIEETDRQAEQARKETERKAKQDEAIRRINEERMRRAEQEEQERLNKQLEESGAQLGQAIKNLIEVNNSYALDVRNTTKYPYRINLDGHILGVVNPYKTERFVVSVEIYGRMQAVQTSGYMFSPTIKEFRIPRQQKQTACSVVIQ